MPEATPAPPAAPGAPITLKSATRLPCLLRDGRPPHVGTLIRWATRGVRRGGVAVRLGVRRLGGVNVTTAAEVEEFLERLNTPADNADAPTPSQRERQVRSAEAELASAGYCTGRATP